MKGLLEGGDPPTFWYNGKMSADFQREGRLPRSSDILYMYIVHLGCEVPKKYKLEKLTECCVGYYWY